MKTLLCVHYTPAVCSPNTRRHIVKNDVVTRWLMETGLTRQLHFFNSRF